MRGTRLARNDRRGSSSHSFAKHVDRLVSLAEEVAEVVVRFAGDGVAFTR
jgi:hypothetical protein